MKCHLLNGRRRLLRRGTRQLQSPSPVFPAHAGVIQGVIAYNYPAFLLLKNAHADIYDTHSNHYLEVNTTSNYEYDLSSFYPRAEFDNLLFGRLDFDRDNLYIYNLRKNIAEIREVAVNQAQSFEAQQNQPLSKHI